MSRSELETLAQMIAAQYGVPYALVAGVIQTESAWDPGAVSGAGARGLMQLMPKTFAGMGFSPNLIMDPQTNITAGVTYLSQMLSRYGGSWALAAMAYNGGPGTVDAAIKRAGSQDPDAVSAQIKASETRAYWKKVLNWAAEAAGKISTTEAHVQAAAAEVSADVQGWAQSNAGKMLLIALAVGSAWILFRGIRG